MNAGPRSKVPGAGESAGGGPGRGRRKTGRTRAGVPQSMSAMSSYPATAVVPADTAADFEEALPLLYAYAEWLQSVIGLPPAERQPDLRREFSDPASMYAPPRGRMLLGRVGSLVRGVVCVRVDETGVAELKRLYVDPAARGVGWIIAEGGVPRRVKSAFLSDTDAADLAAYAVMLRGKATWGDVA